jgi:hypothetical protein
VIERRRLLLMRHGAVEYFDAQGQVKRDVINRNRKCHKWRVVGFSLAAKE